MTLHPLTIAEIAGMEIVRTISRPWRVLKLADPSKLRNYILFHWTAAKASRKWLRLPENDRIASRLVHSYEDYLELQAMKLNFVDLRNHERRFRLVLRERLSDLNFIGRGRNVLCLGARLGAEVEAFVDVGCFAVGVDLNPGPGNKWVLHGDFHRLQVASQSVDVIYSNSIDHCFDLSRMVHEMCRVLKPSGHIILEPDPGCREGDRTSPDMWQMLSWKTIDDLVDELERLGLHLIGRRPFLYPRGGEQLVLVPEGSGSESGDNSLEANREK